MTNEKIQSRLREIRLAIVKERVSYGEVAELQGLAEHIPEDDVVLREWAGIPEFNGEAATYIKLVSLNPDDFEMWGADKCIKEYSNYLTTCSWVDDNLRFVKTFAEWLDTEV